MTRDKTYVFIQFSAIILIVILSKVSIWTNVLASSLFIVGLVIAFIPISQKRFRVNVFPRPTENMQLITSGIYRYIRHPMYLSVLLVTFSLIVVDIKLITLGIWFVLLINLIGKMNYEEAQMEKVFPEYAQYKNETKRLLPYIY